MLLAVFSGAAAFFGSRVPSSFLPDEDQGYLFVNLQLPNASSMQRTDEAARQVEKILADTPGVKYTSSVIGFSLLSFVRTSYNAFFFVTLDDWDARKSRAEQFQEIKTRLNQKLSQMPEAIAFDFSPPAIPGVGTSGGFTFVLEDRAGKEVEFLTQNLNTFMAAVRKRPEIGLLGTTYLSSVPQQFVTVDRDKVIKQGVNISDVYKTLQAFMGGYFINYFNRFGRQWQVYIEAEGEYRTRAENVGQFYVRNNKGEDVPLSALTKFEPQIGPEFTMRFNEYRGAQIFGSAAPGYSSAQAMKALEEVFAQTMPREMGYDYKDMSFQEKLAQQGVSPTVVFAFSLLFVFLILAALYESWSLPFSVLLSTPVAVFGAFATLWLRRTVAGWFYPPYMVQIESDVYSQIGLGNADRAGSEKRDPHCGVRQGRVRARKTAGGRCVGRRQDPAPTDLNDVICVHPRERAFVGGYRGRVRGAPDHRNDSNWRDASGQRHCHISGSRDFLSCREMVRRR